MNTKILKYVVLDILQSRFVVAYTLLLFAVSVSLFTLEGNVDKGILSLLNVVLIVVPLLSVVFSTIHFYNSYEFIELLLAQPVPRLKILMSQYAGVALSLSLALALGMGLPIVLFAYGEVGLSLLASGVLLTLIFTAIGFLSAVLTRDKAKGIGIALLLWFYFAILYDGLVLYILFSFSDYPLEKLTLLLVSLNPVDLGRIVILLKMDIAALMGYTGALYQQFFGSVLGILFSLGIMVLWWTLPISISSLVFRKKDL
ncbi:MAG: ABC transporter permease subunit [Microscillaceae bacterium]|nr:ABC transporter permease subunit [Microscillaceae bacterium]